MNHYQISLALMAMSIDSNALTIAPTNTMAATQLRASTANDFYFMEEIPTEPTSQTGSDQNYWCKPAPPKSNKASPKKGALHGKDGVLAPVVITLKAVVGEEELNKVRGKVIAMHSDVIKNFVDTADSPFGQTVLKTMFAVADTDKNGTLEEVELNKALESLGFESLSGQTPTRTVISTWKNDPSRRRRLEEQR
jgi:hypothetical protein